MVENDDRGGRRPAQWMSAACSWTPSRPLINCLLVGWEEWQSAIPPVVGQERTMALLSLWRGGSVTCATEYWLERAQVVALFPCGCIHRPKQLLTAKKKMKPTRRKYSYLDSLIRVSRHYLRMCIFGRGATCPCSLAVLPCVVCCGGERKGWQRTNQQFGLRAR